MGLAADISSQEYNVPNPGEMAEIEDIKDQLETMIYNPVNPELINNCEELYTDYSEMSLLLIEAAEKKINELKEDFEKRNINYKFISPAEKLLKSAKRKYSSPNQTMYV